ncbi:MAG TPA: circadian clock protein KaiC [Syntrophorhabdaceae bacterium]|jgi:circadian clock protein KaiC
MPRRKPAPDDFTLKKCPTGIQGLDEITLGGIPKGRPTLVTGGAGSGKTLIALEFLVKGATLYDEPGVFMAFEETGEELTANVSSLGFNLDALTKEKKLALDYVYIERSEIEETGEYDLEGLFIRLSHAIDSINAKRVVLDTLEVLFSSLPNEGILRAELRRLFRWLKKKGVTAIVTGERGLNTFTRYGLEEYVADCVILLDHRVTEQVSTRRLRVVKYRGSCHGTNEYPFLIDKDGISILPITSLGLNSEAPLKRVSTGIPRLDAMFEGKGYYRGSSVLISGRAGTGKSTMAAQFAEGTCKRKERALYLAFEESPNQIVRNMRSAGIDLKPCIDSKNLIIRSERPTLLGLEMHLLQMTKLVDEFKPHIVVMDPITNLISVAAQTDVKSMLTRFVDFLKAKQVTSLFTSLTSPGTSLEQSDVSVSSLMDTWIVLKDIEGQGERNRGLTIIKSRGMAHSNQFREFKLTAHGLMLEDVYLGASGALTGAARQAQVAEEQVMGLARTEEIERLNRQIERKRAVLESQLTVYRSEFEEAEEEIRKHIAEVAARTQAAAGQRIQAADSRKADEATIG